MMQNQDLKIEELEIGSGTQVIKGALISCHYRGTLEDGSQFDSSYDRGRPFQFVVGAGRVIKGWDLGFIGMKVGGKRKLFIPSHLAYGDREIGGGLIKANSNLIFHVELLECRLRED